MANDPPAAPVASQNSKIRRSRHALRLRLPRMTFYLPSGGEYRATMVNGMATRGNDSATGVRAGRLIRPRRVGWTA